jgi:hypothetical protein
VIENHSGGLILGLAGHAIRSGNQNPVFKQTDTIHAIAIAIVPRSCPNIGAAVETQPESLVNFDVDGLFSSYTPVIGNVMRVPCGPAPRFCVGAVLSRSDIRGRVRMAVLLSADDGEGATSGPGVHPAKVAKAASLRTSLCPPPLEARVGLACGLAARIDGFLRNLARWAG